jgi:glycosyltransferase involved in cell wall biosynthesis
VQVITRQTDPPCAPRERIDGVRVRRIRPGGQIKGAGWRALPRIAGYLPSLALQLLRAARRCDVMIVSGAKVIPLVAVPLCRALGKRCIVRVESTCELVEPISKESAASMRPIGPVLGGLARRVQRAALEGADDVIATSSTLAAMLAQSGVSGAHVREIPNGIDLRRFRPASAAERERLRAALAWPAHGTILLFVARLSRAKGIDLLADAWPEIAARHPGLCLVIAGTGAGSFDDCEHEVAESIRRSGLGPDRVRMTGATDRVPEYLRAADLFILPSDYEGFSLGIVEALATGLPSILTPVGVVPQLVRDGENGFLFLPRDRAGMIAAIDAAMSARDRWCEIGGRARQAVLSMDLEAVAREYALICTAPPRQDRSRDDRRTARDEQTPEQQQNTASHEHEALPR